MADQQRLSLTEGGFGKRLGQSIIDRALNLFGDVRKEEATLVLLMFLNIFVLLFTWYLLKTTREPLILLTGGAELAAYAAAAQAIVLIGFVRLYGWFSSRLPREKLIVVVILFFVVCLELFYVGGKMGIPYLGFIFYVWAGIFTLATIAQFWSYANDLYRRADGERLFPVIAVGATAGAPVGAKTAQWMFNAGVTGFEIMQFAAVLLGLHLVLYVVIARKSRRTGETRDQCRAIKVLSKTNGFQLIFQNSYLRLIALLILLLNIVNTTGEYILRDSVMEAARLQAALGTGMSAEAFVGSFYGGFFFWVNIITILIQAFLVSRIVKYLGILGGLLVLPLISLGTYGLVAGGVSFVLFRWAKTAENSTDYSLMNTVKQMLWLPTTRTEKYNAKQAIDTFFVRGGDLLSSAVVFLSIHVFSLERSGFGLVNVGLTFAWIGVGLLLHRRYQSLTSSPRETRGIFPQGEVKPTVA
jgi:AAA family ATP:ADP antiporter